MVAMGEGGEGLDRPGRVRQQIDMQAIIDECELWLGCRWDA